MNHAFRTAVEEDIEALHLFIEQGTDINSQEQNGNSAIILAAQNGKSQNSLDVMVTRLVSLIFSFTLVNLLHSHIVRNHHQGQSHNHSA